MFENGLVKWNTFLIGRVYLTFRVKSAHKIKLTEKHLLHWMSPIMVIMLLYLFAWTISDPPSKNLIIIVVPVFSATYNKHEV